MTFPTVDRYADMVHAIVPGSFYENQGILLPFRSGPTQFRLEVGVANSKYGVYVNEIFTGTVLSDASGNVVFERVLPKNEVEIALESQASGTRVFTYVTVREYALWLASYAEALEVIDDNVIQVSKNVSIDTADITALQEAYGEHYSFYANIGQGTEAYRGQVKELRSAFRSYGGKFKGLNEAVAEITQVPPFGYSRRKWGPNWVLDQDFAMNHRFLDRAHTLSVSATPPWVTGVTLVKAEPDVVASPGTPHELHWDSTAKTLTWDPDGNLGTPVSAREGELFLPGPALEKAYILGLVETYNIVAPNNKLYINIDNLGVLEVTITAGAARTAAQVVTDIDTALTADLRYGAAYAADCSAYNSKVLLTSHVVGGSVSLEAGDNNCAPGIFGVKPGDIKFNPLITGPLWTITGTEARSISGAFPDTSDARVWLWYNAAAADPFQIRWHINGVAYGAYVQITTDGVYTLTDAASNILKVYVTVDELPLASMEVQWEIDFSRHKQAPQQSQGLWVNVDVSSLPIVNRSDTVTLYDDSTDGYNEFPDHWFSDIGNNSNLTDTFFYPSEVVASSEGALDPSSAFRFRLKSTTNSAAHINGALDIFPVNSQIPRGSNFPQRGYGGVYDYEGLTLTVSGWFKNLDSSALDLDLRTTFDGNTFNLGSSTVTIPANAGGLGYEDPTFLALSVTIPANLEIGNPLADWVDFGAMFVLLATSAGATIDYIVDGVSATVEYISSKYLTNATVARSRHRQYFGELAWLWSPEALSLTEQKYLGLQHKAASPASVIGGVGISSISTDTPNGVGTFEYEYTAATALRRFRWQPFGTAYAPGLGWTTISSDGTYTLTAPDASTIDVDVVYSILPDLVGTSPVVATRSITITDASIERGLPRKISPAHSALDIFDVTEYDASGDPINLFGAITEADFSLCGFVNAEIQSADPFKYAYVYPEFPSQEAEVLSLALVGANYDATLDYVCDEDQTAAILYENGIPVPNDMWSFSTSTTVSIPQAWFISGDLSLTATFTIDYDLLYQVETPAIDLGAAFADYAWFADYFLWSRYDKTQDTYEVTVPVYFNLESGRAYLSGRSDMNRSTSELFVQRANERIIISNRYWRFENASTISIDSGALLPGSYYLVHKESRVYLEDSLTTTFEIKSANTAIGLAGASYVEIDRNENILTEDRLAVTYRYHQLRLSVSGIRDLSDFRIRSLVMKGLHVHGSSPSVDGLTNIWG